MKTLMNDTFKLAHILLTMVGQWPYQKPIDYLPRRCFILLTLSAFMFAQIRTLWIYNFESELLFKNAQLLGITVLGYVMLVTFYIDHSSGKQLLEIMYEDWCRPSSEAEMKIKERYIAEFRITWLIISSFLVVVCSSCILITAFPMILDAVTPLNYTRPRALLFYLDLYIDDQKYFIVYMAFYYTSYIVGSFTFIANMYMVGMLVYHICGMFKALGYRFEHACDAAIVDRDESKSVANQDDIVYRNVILCIEMHWNTERLSDIIETWIAPIVLEYMIFSAIIISFSLAPISNLDTFTFESFINVVFHFAIIVIAMNTGQRVINISMETCEQLYRGKWYNSPLRAQKLLLMIMQCCTPHSIHGFKIVHLSLETAQAIFKTAISYCLILRTS